MYKSIFLLIFIFSSLSLHAYSKKIVMSSFSNEQSALNMLKSLPLRTPAIYEMSKNHNFEFNVKKSDNYYILVAEVFSESKTLILALKEIRKSFKGAYANESTAAKKESYEQTSEIEVEPTIVETVDKSISKIELQKSVEQTEAEIKIEENVSKVAQPEIKYEKPEQNNTLVSEMPEEKPEAELKEIVVQESTVEETKPEPEIKKAEIKEEPKEEEAEGESYFHWWYILILIILGVVTHYFIKFKKIYDEY